MKDKKLRVLMVEHSGRGGMYAYTDALCMGLSKAGADITVLTSLAWPDKTRPFTVEKRLSEFTPEQGRWSKLHWAADRISRCTLNSLRRNLYAVKEKFDVVHIQGAGMPLLDQFFFRHLSWRRPLVLTVHDIKSHYDRFVSRDSFFKRSLHIPHRLIVHYQNGKRQLNYHQDIKSNNIDVIPHGIMPVSHPSTLSEARKRLKLPLDRQLLLFFGSIRPNKGLDVLLEAMEVVRQHKPQALLVIAGALPRGMSFKPYSDVIEKLHLSEHVRSHVHFIEDQDVDSFVSACEIVVLPYLSFEAQSGVLLRAYAHRKPVVVSNLGAMGELVTSDKVGLVVEPGEVKSLAEAVVNVLTNADKFSSCYNSKLENKYSWEHIAELTIRSYEKAIEIKNKDR